MCSQSNPSTENLDAVLLINRTTDFGITGNGTSENWAHTEWVQLTQLSNHDEISYTTKVKILYTETGIYFLFENEDHVLTAAMDEDYMELWNEDVIEIFLWPDEKNVTYFEYELSPLNYELPILVSNKNGEQAHWIPFSYSYQDARKVQHKTSVSGGEKKSGASIGRWKAEIFIPLDLLRPLNNISPKPGTKWRANLYRIDYDKGETLYAWQSVNESFHEYENFGIFAFQ